MNKVCELFFIVDVWIIIKESPKFPPRCMIKEIFSHSWPWTTKPVWSHRVYLEAKKHYGSKWLKLNFWLVVRITKNLIWPCLKVIFSKCRFFFFAPSDSRFSNSCISSTYFKKLTYDWCRGPSSQLWSPYHIRIHMHLIFNCGYTF